MLNRQIDLISLGWSKWFEAQADLCASHENTFARVAAVDRDQFLLINQTGQFRAKMSGHYLYQHEQSYEFPCVGDWVRVVKKPSDDFALIRSLLDRKTSLRRRSVGDAHGYQMIAANVDYIVIVQSCHYDFNLKRLERYLVMVAEGGAEPWVLLTKTDLVEPAILASQLADIRTSGITTPVFPLSNMTREGVDEFVGLLLPGKTYCFVGSSGVGKSTLINGLIGRNMLETKDVSGTGEGRHTTVRRELILLEGGALVIDNPGMREFGILGADSGIDGSFSDITSLAAACRYRNCTHTNEPGCAVIKSLEAGEIGAEHYDNYFKLSEESAFSQMSYAEKRKKDRDFGKHIKSAKKDLKHD